MREYKGVVKCRDGAKVETAWFPCVPFYESTFLKDNKLTDVPPYILGLGYRAESEPISDLEDHPMEGRVFTLYYREYKPTEAVECERIPFA